MRLEPATPGGTRTRNPQIKNSDAAPPLGIEPRTWWLTATRSAKRSREDSNPRPKGSDIRASNGDWTACLVALLCRPNGHGARLLNDWTCPCGLESHRHRNFNFRRDSNPPPQAGLEPAILNWKSDPAPPLGIEPWTWRLTAARSAKRSRGDSNPREKGSGARAQLICCERTYRYPLQTII